MKNEEKGMSGKRFRGFIFFTALALQACVSPFFAQTTSTLQAPSLLELDAAVEQTAVAAQTQTAIFAPPSLTPSPTRFPTGTLIAAASAPTFLFALPTITPLPTWTPTPGAVIQIPGGGGNATDDGESIFTGKEWTCAIRDKNPPMDAVIPAGTSFYVSITLFNNGTRAWPQDSVDFRYKSGLRNEGKPIQDLPKTIKPGNQITLQIALVAPDKPDTYSTIWTLKVGNNPFCGVKYSFQVK
jgi:hypothetical protein